MNKPLTSKNRQSKGGFIPPENALPPPPPPKRKMNITYDQVFERANVLYKNKMQEKYGEKYPDMDMNKVVLELNEGGVALLEALIEAINESK